MAGQVLLQALGDRKGINRFGDFSAPLDEALVHVALACFRSSTLSSVLFSHKIHSLGYKVMLTRKEKCDMMIVMQLMMIG